MHDLLTKELDRCNLMHWAPNCATFSRARERPIPGVAFSPPPLRSESFPKGLPWVCSGKNKRLAGRVELDTRMADMAAEDCILAHKEGRAFSLEHPEGSLARFLPSWQALEREEGVFSTPYHACMFHPCKRRKKQVLIHNRPELGSELNLTCQSEKVCSRTGKPHKSWKPSVRDGKVVSFQTGQEREYPSGFCEAYARAVRSISEKRDIPITFLEVFSGPGAPLTKAVALSLQTDTPQIVVDNALMTRGEFHELNDQSGVSGSPPNRETHQKEEAPPLRPPGDFGETTQYRLAAVESSRQPSYGKRISLIEDGMNSPEDHVRTAKRLKHPFDGEFSIKSDHEEAVRFLNENKLSVNKFRMKQLARLRSMVDGDRASQRKESQKACWTCRKLQVRPSTVTMRRLQSVLDIEDKEVPNICLEGLPIIGDASCSPFFEEMEVPPTMSVSEFYGDMEERGLRCIERVKYMAEKSSYPLAKAIHEKTLKEVAQGTMGPAMSYAEVKRKYNSLFNIVPSFGLEQGVDESGNAKYRRIDDHSASGNNAYSHRKQKVPMTMVDYVATLLKYSARVLNTGHKLASEDMKSAYRQIAIRPDHVRFSITAVYDPDTKQVQLHEIYGQPFGAGHAVPNFCRVAEWLCRCIRRLFKSSLDHFFDDFFVIEPMSTIAISTFCIRESFKLLGFSLDPDKSQPPSEVAAVLGVVFNTESLSSQKVLRVQAKPSRIRNLELMINQVLESNSLSATQAASLVGKFNFLCSTLFGKVGRCATLPLRQRQYSKHDKVFVNDAIRTSLLIMKELLKTSPHREVTLEELSPHILYTDASDVPGRNPQQVLGAYLWDPISKSQHYSSVAVPSELLMAWQQRKSYMGQLEILAAFFGLSTWSKRLAGRKLLLFVDNDSAGANLVRGYSPLLDSGALAGAFWLLASSMRVAVYIDRAESKSNPSDGPSRLDFSLMRSWRADWTEPDLGQLGSPTLHPDYWFGTASNNRGDTTLDGGSL